jgi:hypothetical protein
MSDFKVGDKVFWKSSYTEKRGTVIEVVKPGSPPQTHKTVESRFAREKQSYVIGDVRMKKYLYKQNITAFTPVKGTYWPHASLLRLAREGEGGGYGDE